MESGAGDGTRLHHARLGFLDIRKFAPGTHCGLILVRLRLPGRTALARRVREVFAAEPVSTWARSFVLVTDLKVRVHPPKS